MTITLSLSYSGLAADNNQIGFYDTAQALMGFERLISLTTHLLVNGEVITQSPSAKGFALVALPAVEGSWTWNSLLAVGATLNALALLSTADSGTKADWLVASAIDYVVRESLGFEPNFDETLGAQIERHRSEEPHSLISPGLTEDRFDSLIEKCEPAIRGMHRPIVFSETASVGGLQGSAGTTELDLGGYLDAKTYEYVSETKTSDDIHDFVGVISSYNSNTFRGRLYVPSHRRTIPFELSAATVSPTTVDRIVSSLRKNAVEASRFRNRVEADIVLRGFRNESSTGRLKGIYVTEIE